VARRCFRFEGLFDALRAKVNAAEPNDLRDVDGLFDGSGRGPEFDVRRVVQLARKNLVDHFDGTERLMRLGLKAQSQSRATLETLATIKNPTTVFARQANVAHGPQQVNNLVAVASPTLAPHARAGELETAPNKLLEAHGERLDVGAASATGRSDSNAGGRGNGRPGRGRLQARRDRRGMPTVAASDADGVKS